MYGVTDVIKHQSVNEDCDDEDKDEYESSETSRNVSFRSIEVSKRLIDQFFSELEDRDPDWSKDYCSFLQDEDRLELKIDDLL